jgi:hypothetical protein
VPIDLIGTWVNEDLRINKYPRMGVLDQFMPVSGFSIEYDSLRNVYDVELQYGEQKGNFKFKNIYLSLDTLIGVNDDLRTVVGHYDTLTREISDLNLIDTGVYSNYSTRSGKDKIYSKISDCPVKCSIEQFSLNRIYLDTSLSVNHDSKQITLTFKRNECVCNGVIEGLSGYRDCQVIDAFSDTSGQQIIGLAIYNLIQKGNVFFNLVHTKGHFFLIRQ